MQRMYAEFENTERLKDRFEERFPLIYLGDEVIVSSRWGARGENPQKGKAGIVRRMEHGLQSVFNRDYLIFTMDVGEGEWFQAWLYTLDLKERYPDNTAMLKMGKMPVYIDDRVQVTSPYHPRRNRTGNVRAVGLESGQTFYEVRDDAFSWLPGFQEDPNLEEYPRLVREMLDTERTRIAEMLDKSNEEDFLKYCARFLGYTTRPQFTGDEIAYLKKEFWDGYVWGLKREVLEDLSRELSYQNLERRVKELEEESTFRISAQEVTLIEQFPPNKLFKTE